MDAIGIIRMLGEMGLRFKGEGELDRAILYFINMIKDERICIVYDEGEPYAMIAYSMTDDPDTFLKKDTWNYLQHNPHGKIVYVEKMASKGWNRQIRTIFEHVISTKYPQMESGIWHRWAKFGDRKVIAKRRLINV